MYPFSLEGQSHPNPLELLDGKRERATFGKASIPKLTYVVEPFNSPSVGGVICCSGAQTSMCKWSPGDPVNMQILVQWVWVDLRLHFSQTLGDAKAAGLWASHPSSCWSQMVQEQLLASGHLNSRPLPVQLVESPGKIHSVNLSKPWWRPSFYWYYLVHMM